MLQTNDSEYYQRRWWSPEALESREVTGGKRWYFVERVLCCYFLLHERGWIEGWLRRPQRALVCYFEPGA